MGKQEATTIAVYAYAIVDALDEFGLDGTAIIRDTLDGSLPSSDPLARMSAATVSELFAVAVKATGDPFIGLRVGHYVCQKGLHALGIALMASSTIRQFSARLERYFRLVSQAGVVQIDESADSVAIRIVVEIEGVCFETEEALISALVLMIRSIYSGEFNPILIELRRPDPGKSEKAFTDAFHCPVQFGQITPAIHFEKRYFDVELPAASREIAFQNDQIIMSYLSKMDRADIEAQVRMAIIELLSTGNVDKNAIAARMHMSPRTLQYRLAQAGTSYKNVLEDVRQNLAMTYLEIAGPSVTEITYSLGFADTSNFTRAFKRWTGLSPTEYRQQHKG